MTRKPYRYTTELTLKTDAGLVIVTKTIETERPPKFSTRVKRGLALMLVGTEPATRDQRDDLAAAREWIAWGVEHSRWADGKQRRRVRPPVAAHPAWREREDLV